MPGFGFRLQQIYPLPFRILDEMNQGMDASNEAGFWKLAVKTAVEAGQSQVSLLLHAPQGQCGINVYYII
jgi:hypothetical protein